MASKKSMNTPHTCEFCEWRINLNDKQYCPKLLIDVDMDEHCPLWKEKKNED